MNDNAADRYNQRLNQRWLAATVNNRELNIIIADIVARFDEIESRLERMEKKRDLPMG